VLGGKKNYTFKTLGAHVFVVFSTKIILKMYNKTSPDEGSSDRHLRVLTARHNTQILQCQLEGIAEHKAQASGADACP